MLDHKGFDLWADGYDESVGVSDEDHTYPLPDTKRSLAASIKQSWKSPIRQYWILVSERAH